MKFSPSFRDRTGIFIWLLGELFCLSVSLEAELRRLLLLTLCRADVVVVVVVVVVVLLRRLGLLDLCRRRVSE